MRFEVGDLVSPHNTRNFSRLIYAGVVTKVTWGVIESRCPVDGVVYTDMRETMVRIVVTFAGVVAT